MTVAPPGEFGKPRPALVLQSDGPALLETLTYLPITSDLLHVPDLRVPIAATVESSLRLDSQVMVDMIQTSSLAKFGQVIGHVDALTLIRVEAALAMHLGLVDGPGTAN